MHTLASSNKLHDYSRRTSVPSPIQYFDKGTGIREALTSTTWPMEHTLHLGASCSVYCVKYSKQSVSTDLTAEAFDSSMVANSPRGKVAGLVCQHCHSKGNTNSYFCSLGLPSVLQQCLRPGGKVERVECWGLNYASPWSLDQAITLSTSNLLLVNRLLLTLVLLKFTCGENGYPFSFLDILNKYQC